MTLNDRLFQLSLDLAKYPGDSTEDALNRRIILRRALTEHGDGRYTEGYHDGRRDMSDAQYEARQRADTKDATEAATQEAQEAYEQGGSSLETLRASASLPSTD